MRTITFEVELNMFAQGVIREVEVPADDIEARMGTLAVLDHIWKWGQNELQPMSVPSVSMGDVIRYDGRRWLITAEEYKELKEGDITVGFIPLD